MTIAAWCAEWCATTLEASDRKPTTKAPMRSLIRSHVTTTKIGDVPLAKLRPSHYDAWLLELRRKALSPATVQRVFRVLAVVLDGAVRDDHLAYNPARKVTQPTVERHDARVLSAEKVRRILEAAQALMGPW
jgi:integrase